MKFAFIHVEKAFFPVAALCRVLEVTRQGYYAYAKRSPSRRQRDDEALRERVRTIHKESDESYGSPRVQRKLQRDGLRVGKQRIERAMLELGLVGQKTRQFRVTTVSDPSHAKAENLLDREADEKRGGSNEVSSTVPQALEGATPEKPAVPEEIKEVYFPPGPSSQLATYVPVLVGSATVRFSDPKTGLDHARDVTFTTPVVPGALVVDWARAKWSKVPPSGLHSDPVQDARFSELPKEATKAKSYASWQKAFVAWLCDTQGVGRPYVAKWKLYGAPGESEISFRAKIEQKVREERDAAVEALNAKYTTKFDKLRDAIAKAHADVAQKESDARFENVGSALSMGAQVMSFFGGSGGGRRILGSAASVAQKAGRISKSRSTLEDRRKKLSDLQAKGQELDAEYRAEVSKITSTAALPGIETSVVKPKKTGIDVRFFALGWMPA